MNIVYTGELDPRLCKAVLGETIPALVEKDPDVVYLDADLMSCIGTAKWAQGKERAINCGIAEANMIGVACGLASAGFKPIVHTFGPFASRRCYDQIFLSAGYAKNDVTDPNMIAGILEQCLDRPGVKYIRVSRKGYATVYEDGAVLPIGKAVTLREGTDAAIFACGIMVHEAMQAAKALADEGIEAAVLDMFTIKPLDAGAVEAWAKKTGAVVVAENHNRIGGLYSAVSEVLVQRCPVPAGCVAVEDEFGEVGPQDYLQKRFGLTAEHIIAEVRATVARKG